MVDIVINEIKALAETNQDIKLRVSVDPEVYEYLSVTGSVFKMSASRYLGFIASAVYIKSKEQEKG